MRGTLVVSFEGHLYLVTESSNEFYYATRLRMLAPFRQTARTCLRKSKCVVVPSTTIKVSAEEYGLILSAYYAGTEHTAYYKPTKSSSNLTNYNVARFSSPGKKSIVAEIEAHRVIPARKRLQKRYSIRDPMIKVITKQYVVDTWGTRKKEKRDN